MSAVGQLLPAFAGVRVLVVGDVMIDRYLLGSTNRLCREGPVPIVDLDETADQPGGAANTAANLAALGARTSLMSVVGDDADANVLRAALERAGVQATLLASPGRPTLLKHRLVADEQLLVRFDVGGAERTPPELESALMQRLLAAVADVDAVVVSDYDYGLCSPALRAALAGVSGRRILAVDARSPARYRELAPTMVKPNYEEALPLLDAERVAGPARATSIERNAQRLLERTGARMVTVTLDADGVVLLERGGSVHRVAARPGSPRRATGAGDTFLSAFTLSLAAGADPVAAAEVASAAAAVVVAKPGTSVCTAQELRLSLEGATKTIEGLDALSAQAQLYRDQGRRVVFTNGCFDILHRGHVAYLNRAKLLGDVLIVGVNSDASVRRLKNPERPVNPLEDRLQVLAALGCVDHVVAFDDDTATRLVEAVRPDVYVKGGDYTSEMLPEASAVERVGGVVQILSYVEDRSTTRLIDLLRGAGERPAKQALESR